MAGRLKQLSRNLAAPVTGVASLLVLLAWWQWASDHGGINPFVAPSPLGIVHALPELFQEDGLAWAFVQSFAETLAALALATCIGMPLGWWLSRNRLAGFAYEGWVANLAAAPLVLLYPLFLVIFGRNSGTIIVMSALTAMPPIALKTKEGLDTVRPALINVGRSLRLSPASLFCRIQLPAAAPVVATGLRLGLILALISVVGIEYLIDFDGMGALIATMGDRFEIPKMFGAITFVVVISITFYFLGERLEKWLSRA